MCAHWFCCAWHLLGVAFSPSWGDGGGSDGGPQLELPLNEMAIGDAYVVSIYWAVTTMSTIGYGDIKSITNLERFVSIVTMLCGSVIFGVVVSGMQALMDQINSVQHRTQEKLDTVKAMLNDRQLPRDLRGVQRANVVEPRRGAARADVG